MGKIFLNGVCMLGKFSDGTIREIKLPTQMKSDIIHSIPVPIEIVVTDFSSTIKWEDNCDLNITIKTNEQF